ncbi:hypothetical protein AMES_6332 [Amycolatopsis mediterranei S699]|uniref:Uncharacterized protein n=2 Tax=Amycolatopsis mediterranei TaxID=33910 RepID=A0A0H3DD56_AMYMU|nr:hypothetical protein [Amycolatopsis mediterranei]ADJ48157.1 hypothetical protein AMED_6425 [Amycolatopsis mediterranei U32]AEK45060.1 hypothetical protein RAM_32935 [Amycolatopsis mediterranei S699]AFO79868.1 hypothetical protein AMES_6332 [Amycolatopsis mediterranei S699]AGT86996.1 hypothetical protein B737_6332 [Amycolatopsis mediterranei RB]KDO10642.1 hypothetical protein DV26_12185 [Amycolatopsis mediterranei]
MLTEEQRRQIVPLIVDHLGVNLSGSAAIDLFGVDAVRLVPAGLNDYRRASALLDHTLAAVDWVAFARVVETVDRAGVLVEVHHLVEALRRSRIQWNAVGAGDLWVPVAWPFADRRALRQIVYEIALGAGPAAMTIEAPAGHGKRTMCSYIELCAQRHRKLVTVVEHLSCFDDPGVLDSVVTQLRMWVPARPGARGTTHHEPERRAAELARDLARDAALGGTPVWFIANVLEAELDDGVLRFVDELLGQVQADPLVAKGLRITVLADDIAALGLTNLPGLDDRHTLPDITEPEIAAWLRDAAPGRDRRLYDLAARMVLTDVDARTHTPRMRLRLLAQQCVIAHRQLAGAPQ